VGTRPHFKAHLACILLRHTVKTNQPFVASSPKIKQFVAGKSTLRIDNIKQLEVKNEKI